MTLSKLGLLTSLSILGTITSSAATLNFNYTGQEIANLTFTDAPQQSCIQSTGGNEYPLGCTLDSAGGHVAASIGGNDLGLNTHTINSAYTFQGSATASVFPQPSADTRTAYAGYSFQAVVSALTSGDTFQFRLSETDTCRNSLGSCKSETVAVSGATSIRGSLAKGEVITAAGPVTLDLVVGVSVSDLVPNWTEGETSSLTITPVRETAPKGHASGAAAGLADPVATPEPGSFGLLGIALAGFGLVWRRKAAQ